MEHERSELAGAFSTEKQAYEAVEKLQKMDLIGDWFEVEQWKVNEPIETSQAISSKEFEKRNFQYPSGFIFKKSDEK